MKFLLILFILIQSYAYSEEKISPSKSLQLLVEGNKRYIQGQLLHPNFCQECRTATVEKQTPFATILGCSDSRVPPELLFDQGIGDIFVVRVAGNVAGSIELDSLEYSVQHLTSSLILVLGHKNCGAIDAVLKGKAQDIQAVAALIEPAVATFRSAQENALEDAVKANVSMVVEKLKKSPLFEKSIASGSLAIIGGYYNLRSGEVEILK